MDSLRDINITDKLGRRVLVGRVDHLADWTRIAPHAGRRFTFLLLNDDTPTDGELTALAEDLIARGCVYFLAWGPGCSRAETLFDGVVIQRWFVDAGREITDDHPIIPTTSHQDDSLREAIWCFLNMSQPDDSLPEGVASAIALVRGSAALLQEALDALASDLDGDPDIFPD